MSYVFLSHSHPDKPFARKLAADLRVNGHTVWIDEAEINIGDSLIEKIRDGLDQVDHVCALLSGVSIESAWVQRELDIASNREIDEQRVVVLPLLLEDVPLPGFLRGKLYGDFRNKDQYGASLEALLRALGPIEVPPRPTQEELHALKAQLAAAQETVAAHQAAAARAEAASLRAKSEQLREKIEVQNARFPSHAPINNTYAFEAAGSPITLDYLLWAMSKAKREGGHHVLEALLTIDDKWPEAHLMFEAYADMLDRK